MIFRPYPGTRKDIDLLTGIAPIFRIDTSTNQVYLIGSGFWVTNMGHLVTAWHVVQDNIGENGMDYGPIFAVQTFPDKSVVVRNFSKSDQHPQFDLALSETVTAPPFAHRATRPIQMSLDELVIGEPVFSFAVLSDDQIYENEKIPGLTAHKFRGEILVEGITKTIPIRFAVRLSFGNVSEIFKQMRDKVMLPFPCVQTSVPIYGGNSGGPLFDIRGRIRAVNCTSFGGNDISFHIPVEGVLQLETRRQPLGIKNTKRKHISILELAAMQIVLFDPPMLNKDNLLSATLRLLWYLIKCLVRRERPSTIHFVTEKGNDGA